MPDWRVFTCRGLNSCTLIVQSVTKRRFECVVSQPRVCINSFSNAKEEIPL